MERKKSLYAQYKIDDYNYELMCYKNSIIKKNRNVPTFIRILYQEYKDDIKDYIKNNGTGNADEVQFTVYNNIVASCSKYKGIVNGSRPHRVQYISMDQRRVEHETRKLWVIIAFVALIAILVPLLTAQVNNERMEIKIAKEFTYVNGTIDEISGSIDEISGSINELPEKLFKTLSAQILYDNDNNLMSSIELCNEHIEKSIKLELFVLVITLIMILLICALFKKNSKK